MTRSFPFSSLRRGSAFFWRGLDATRRSLLNLMFLAIVMVLLYGPCSAAAPSRWRRRPRWCST
jgi:hypothetical protein